mmetsp:Transcript_13733/g.43378  ORF Transcript_13733/g.43378 Transcript_13733/m.43378 type:complete len:248 (-) Transcript_13733:512-1255(-)
MRVGRLRLPCRVGNHIAKNLGRSDLSLDLLISFEQAHKLANRAVLEQSLAGLLSLSHRIETSLLPQLLSQGLLVRGRGRVARCPGLLLMQRHFSWGVRPRFVHQHGIQVVAAVVVRSRAADDSGEALGSVCVICHGAESVHGRRPLSRFGIVEHVANHRPSRPVRRPHLRVDVIRMRSEIICRKLAFAEGRRVSDYVRVQRMESRAGTFDGRIRAEVEVPTRRLPLLALPLADGRRLKRWGRCEQRT